jgi:citrate lyase subunit beta/citryl-CoA lyase
VTAAGEPDVIVTGLYVPGDRPDRFDKAVASGAQLVILDLEDAVAPAAKDAAREAVGRWLGDRIARDPAPMPVIEVRINAGADDDLDVLASALEATGSASAFGVRVPKVEHADDVEAVARMLPGVALTALVESACGVAALAELAAHPAVVALALGEADLASDLGSADDAVLDHARLHLVYAARAAGLPAPMMAVYPAIADLDGLRADTERGRLRGFVGRTAVHPSQLPVIRAAFAPTAGEVRWAGDVLAAMTAGGVGRLASGEMVDPAMVGRAHAVLRLAAATGAGLDPL